MNDYCRVHSVEAMDFGVGEQMIGYLAATLMGVGVLSELTQQRKKD